MSLLWNGYLWSGPTRQEVGDGTRTGSGRKEGALLCCVGGSRFCAALVKELVGLKVLID